MLGSWVHRSEINQEKWKNLVGQSNASSVFSLFSYWDACAIDWEAYIALDYSFAIPVGVTKKGGIKRLYSPLFLGYSEPLGKIENIDWEDFEKSLQVRFPKGDFFFSSSHPLAIKKEERIYQYLTKENYKLKSQAKRKIKKFRQSSFTIKEDEIDTKTLAELIAGELSKKLAVFNQKEVAYYYKVIRAMEKENRLFKLGIFDEKKLVGGLIGFSSPYEFLYFKGAVTEKVKKEGGMYALMSQFIERGIKEDKRIHFGGSNVEGVRFFYQRFNGIDKKYYHYSWDHSFWWFRLLYRVWKFFKRI